MAGPVISLPADVLRSSGLEILGSGPGTIPLAEIIGAIPEFMAIAATGDLPIDIDEIPLAEVEAAWQRRVAAGGGSSSGPDTGRDPRLSPNPLVFAHGPGRTPHSAIWSMSRLIGAPLARRGRFASEEGCDQPGHLRRSFEQEQVASAGDNLQPGAGDAAGEDAAVDQRHDRVVVAGEHQGGLGQRSEPGDAGPAGDGVDLAEVPPQRGPFDEPGRRSVEERVGVAAGGAAVHAAGDAPVVVGLVVAAWGGER